MDKLNPYKSLLFYYLITKVGYKVCNVLLTFLLEIVKLECFVYKCCDQYQVCFIYSYLYKQAIKSDANKLSFTGFLSVSSVSIFGCVRIAEKFIATRSKVMLNNCINKLSA